MNKNTTEGMRNPDLPQLFALLFRPYALGIQCLKLSHLRWT